MGMPLCSFAVLFFCVKKFWNPLYIFATATQTTGSRGQKESAPGNVTFKSESDTSQGPAGVGKKRAKYAIVSDSSATDMVLASSSLADTESSSAAMPKSPTSKPRKGTKHPDYSDEFVRPGYEWIADRSATLARNVPNFNNDKFTMFSGKRGPWEQLVDQTMDDVVELAADTVAFVTHGVSPRGTQRWSAVRLHILLSWPPRWLARARAH